MLIFLNHLNHRRNWKSATSAARSLPHSPHHTPTTHDLKGVTYSSGQHQDHKTWREIQGETPCKYLLPFPLLPAPPHHKGIKGLLTPASSSLSPPTLLPLPQQVGGQPLCGAALWPTQRPVWATLRPILAAAEGGTAWPLPLPSGSWCPAA